MTDSQGRETPLDPSEYAYEYGSYLIEIVLITGERLISDPIFHPLTAKADARDLAGRAMVETVTVIARETGEIISHTLSEPALASLRRTKPIQSEEDLYWRRHGTIRGLVVYR